MKGEALELKTGAEKALKQCLNAKLGEKVLIVTDTEKMSIGLAFFTVAREIGCEAMLMLIIPRKVDGEEPPEAVASAIRNTDIFLAPTARSISHTRARLDACKHGARGATLPGITEEIMQGGSMAADYEEVRKTGKKLSEKLQGIREAILTSDNGTNLKLRFGKREWRVDDGIFHKPGDFGNLPAGEVYISPVTAEGILVFDASVSMLGILEEPIRIVVKDGNAVSFEGGRQAAELEKLVKKASGNGRNIAELGIGINPSAKVTGNTLEDEKVAGTIHVAIGDESTIGGELEASIHLDGVIAQSPVLTVDGEEIQLPSGAQASL